MKVVIGSGNSQYILEKIDWIFRLLRLVENLKFIFYYDFFLSHWCQTEDEIVS